MACGESLNTARAPRTPGINRLARGRDRAGAGRRLRLCRLLSRATVANSGARCRRGADPHVRGGRGGVLALCGHLRTAEQRQLRRPLLEARQCNPRPVNEDCVLPPIIHVPVHCLTSVSHFRYLYTLPIARQSMWPEYIAPRI